MGKEEQNGQAYYEIDLMHILKVVWKNIWAVILSSVLAAVIGLLTALFLVDPVYSSEVRLYVQINSDTTSSSNLTAAKSLVKTCGTILTGRSTLERVLEQADLDCTWKALANMITYEATGDTEIMKIIVSCDDPYKASQIANTIADILPQRVEDIISGASMKLVDAAKPNLNKVSPSVTKYTVLGAVLGAMLIIAVLVVLTMLDDTIHDEEYVVRTYNYPILGKVPDMVSSEGSRTHTAKRGKGM